MYISFNIHVSKYIDSGHLASYPNQTDLSTESSYCSVLPCIPLLILGAQHICLFEALLTFYSISIDVQACAKRLVPNLYNPIINQPSFFIYVQICGSILLQ